MSDEKVEITLLASNKSGILSSIMVKGGKAGLMYRRNKLTEIDSDRSRMVINFTGSLNCSKGELIDAMESHPEIFAVESISIGESSSGGSLSSLTPVSSKRTPSAGSGLTLLNAHDAITQESLKIAEEKLLNSLGPVAPMLVKSAAAKTKHIGDLFTLLADDLDGEEKDSFLSLVNGLN